MEEEDARTSSLASWIFVGGDSLQHMWAIFFFGLLHPHTSFIQISQVHELTNIRGWNL